MSAIKVYFEIGHEASLRSKKTPEGFTHDWKVFVRGQEGADISHFVEKVVFYLHETFPKPRRVVKDPPFSIKESGYAGFFFPIEIYLKNKDEPKKIKFSYDFTLQQSGFLKDRYIFQNPNEDFRKKLLKGGGIPISNNAYYTNPDQETRSRDSISEDKPQLVSKPKLSSDIVKKHKSKEHKEEVPHRTSSFENLFGPPIQKPPKVSPDPKKLDKNLSVIKSEKKDKEKSLLDKKSKHELKEIKLEKNKAKDEKEKIISDKVKSHSKDKERKEKDKVNKRQSERPPSPQEPIKKRCLSPKKPSSPIPRSNSASSVKDDYKQSNHNSENYELKKTKIDDKTDMRVDKDLKEKKKKEKKSHERDKEKREKKEHKKEAHKFKESPKESTKEVPKEIPKQKETLKEKEPLREAPPIKEKLIKVEKPINKFSIENLRKTPSTEVEERTDGQKSKEKGDIERKHKHKKKDKKRDELREKHKESSKEKKNKHDKNREAPIQKLEIVEQRETPVPKERPILESASPISIDTASQCSSKSGLAKTSHTGADDINSSHSDSENSVIVEEEDIKMKIDNPSPEPVRHEPSPEPEPEPEPPVVEALTVHKEKSKKHKDKSSRKEEKRRKRKAAEEEDSDNRKVGKNDSGPSHEIERGESSGVLFTETKVQDNGVSSSLGEDAEPGDLSPDYMVQLRGLQQRIMMIKNNEDLERVVNLIAETGRYEVTTQTFDFDLCLLDRSTVQQLIQLVGC